MEKRIEIELEMWESAPAPIFTNGVNTDRAEKLLYQVMNEIYTEQEIETFLAGEGDDYWRNKFGSRLCEEEEKIVIECGGLYYEDIWSDKDCPVCSSINVVKLEDGALYCCDCNTVFE